MFRKRIACHSLPQSLEAETFRVGKQSFNILRNMRKLITVFALAFTAKLYSQDIDWVSCDTCPPYFPPLVFYSDTLKPTITITEMDRHVVIKGKSISAMIRPHFLVLHKNHLDNWDVNYETCQSVLILPDFDTKYVAYLWDDKQKCFRGLKNKQ